MHAQVHVNCNVKNGHEHVTFEVRFSPKMFSIQKHNYKFLAGYFSHPFPLAGLERKATAEQL